MEPTFFLFFWWFKACLVLFNWPGSTALWSIYCSCLMGCLRFQAQQPHRVYFHADDTFTVNNKFWHILCAQVNAPKSGAVNCWGWVAGARTCFAFQEHHNKIWNTQSADFVFPLFTAGKVAFFFSPLSCAWIRGRGMARAILERCTLWEKVTRAGFGALRITLVSAMWV